MGHKQSTLKKFTLGFVYEETALFGMCAWAGKLGAPTFRPTGLAAICFLTTVEAAAILVAE